MGQNKLFKINDPQYHVLKWINFKNKLQVDMYIMIHDYKIVKHAKQHIVCRFTHMWLKKFQMYIGMINIKFSAVVIISGYV